MDLNKDNRDIYTIDSESYSEYMRENIKEPRDLLSAIIQLLIVILLFVLVYLFFNILKNDLTFSEVFNKKELLSTYESLVESDDDDLRVVMDEEVEKVSNKIAIKSTTPKSNEMASEKKEAVSVVTKRDKPIIKKVEKIEKPKVAVVIPPTVVKKVEPVVVASKIEKISVQEKVIKVKEKPMPVETVAVKEKAVEVIKKREVSDETELTESYLDRMVAELNSEN